MSTQQLRLGFAALLASASIASAAQAQIGFNDSTQSGVILSLRPQSTFFVAQESVATSAAKNDSAQTENVGENGKTQDDKALDTNGNDKNTDKLNGAINGDEATSPQETDGGRLSPITMGSVRDPIGAVDISVLDIGTRILPEDQAAKQLVPRLPLPGGQDRALAGLTYRWQAANICHFPLYFEEPMLERHGQQCCPTWIQPAVSGSKFLSNLILYPYKATLHPAFENRYTLGHFRPGSGAPCLRDTLPWSTDAALVQAGATTAVLVGLPW